MSCRGNCYDNAVAERFFWSLIHEWTKHEQYETREEVQRSVFKYIETFYNRQRLHQTLGYKNPRAIRSRISPGTCGVKSHTAAVRKWWALALLGKRYPWKAAITQ